MARGLVCLFGVLLLIHSVNFVLFVCVQTHCVCSIHTYFCVHTYSHTPVYTHTHTFTQAHTIREDDHSTFLQHIQQDDIAAKQLLREVL